jgi:hypothetical protein
MKTDTYTKAVLTLIAACLLWLCLISSGQPLQAQPRQYSALPAQPVVVVGWGRLNPDVPGGIELAWSDAGRRIADPAVPIRPPADPNVRPVRVRIDAPAPLPVSLEGVKKGASWDALRTAAENDPGSRVPGIREPR